MNNIFYPKQINRMRLKTCENQCFFAMPFAAEYTNLYDSLVMHLEREGYKCIRVDNNFLGSVPVMNLILNGIASSQYVIVDISETNANVFYELGITHTVKDYENVFIIKENAATTPFDIQHLQYIAYDKNNLKELAKELLIRLKANQYKNVFKKVLLTNQLIRFEDVDEFVDYFTKLFEEEQVGMYAQLLENSDNTVDESSLIVESIWEYDKVLRSEITKAESEKYIPALFKVLFEILLPCHRIKEIENYIHDFLKNHEYSELYDISFLPYQTDLAIKFAENLKLIDITLKWIIEYFQRSKSTKVDLNRYKLEAFLLKATSEKVNEFIVNAIVSDNKYIREHMADIAGEKKLYIAEDNLISQLKREENEYTISSIVEALGKIGSQKAIDAMEEWLNINADNVIATKDYFVLKHFRNALVKIDLREALQKFDNKYWDILKKNNAI